MFVLCDMEGNMMRLKGELEVQLTMEDVNDQVPSSIAAMNQFCMIEVLGNSTKKEEGSEAGQPSLSFDQCSISVMSLYTDFVLHNVLSNRSSGANQWWQHTTGSVNTPRCL